MKFSIIIVSYNAGNKLKDTIDSVLLQDYDDYEIIVKDGMSTDGSLTALSDDERIKLYSEKDCGIYDAMNHAVVNAVGSYLLFLNCGDRLYSADVLSKMSDIIEEDNEAIAIYYGDNYVRSRRGVVIYPKKLTNYKLMTMTVCHQCIFFSSDIFKQHKYQYNEFQIAADMALYIECVKKYHMSTKHVGFIVCDYESNGVSETNEHRKKILLEKKKIYKKYFTKQEYILTSIQKMITLKYLKEMIGSIGLFRTFYECVAAFYLKKKKEKYKASVATGEEYESKI